jgi:hypothetical protein
MSSIPSRSQAGTNSLHQKLRASWDKPNLLQFLTMSGTRSTAFPSERGYSPAGAVKAASDSADKADIIDEHRSLFHVAATRARGYLGVSWSGKPATLIPALKDSRT